MGLCGGQKRDLAGYKLSYISIVGTKTLHKQQYTYNWQKLRRRLRATPEHDRHRNPSLAPPFLPMTPEEDRNHREVRIDLSIKEESEA